MKTISIAGCGWLGAPLARNLLAEGYTVKGSTTHSEKKSVMKDVGIKPYLLRLEPELSLLEPDDFFDTDLLIICFPPKTRTETEEYHPNQIRAVASEIRKNNIKHCIYISSTSVYAESGQELREDDAPEPEGSKHSGIRQAELLLQEVPGLKLTILRCGGLMGYDRIPGKYFAGKQGLTTGELPVNYVHRDDVIKVILEVIRQNYWNETLNVVALEHPSRKDVYLSNAQEFGFEPPTFAEGASGKGARIVLPDKLLKELQYEFIYPDPLHFFYNK